MIKTFDISANPILCSVVDTIEASLDCPKYRKMTERIEIAIPEGVDFKIPENKKISEKGFGSCLIKSFGYDVWNICIIIDMKNCIKASLTEREITAIVYHELGHILNEPCLEKEPTFEFCFIHQIDFNKELLDKIRDFNCMKMEVFADSYANRHGYGAELVSTFHKQNENFEQKIGYMEIRIEKIQSKKHLEGKIISTKDNSNYQ
jgi:hypothetical protein